MSKNATLWKRLEVAISEVDNINDAIEGTDLLIQDGIALVTMLTVCRHNLILALDYARKKDEEKK